MGTPVARRLTRRERIEARHWLQVLAEHARSVRNAMDPVAGLPVITAGAWEGQWAALRADLDAYTERVRLDQPAPGGISDRNAGPGDEEAGGRARAGRLAGPGHRVDVMTDLHRGLDRKQWVQLREAVYIAHRALSWLAGHGSPEAGRALAAMTRVLGRGWDGRSVYLDPDQPPPGPGVYDHPEEHRRPDTFGQWMDDRRAARVAITGEARQAEWEQAIAGRRFLDRLDRNEVDEVLTMMSELWQQATAPDVAAPG